MNLVRLYSQYIGRMQPNFETQYYMNRFLIQFSTESLFPFGNSSTRPSLASFLSAFLALSSAKVVC